MYQFASQEQESAYRTALANGNKQNVSCLIHDKTGQFLQATYEIVDSPSIDIRCVEDEDVFNIAEMYVGELNIRFWIAERRIRTDQLIGGFIELSWSIETDEYTVGGVTYDAVGFPIGVWDIADAHRDSEHFISVKANDRIARLSAPMDRDGFVGVVTIESVMNRIKTVLGAQTLDEIFAQTPAQIEAMGIDVPFTSGMKFSHATHYEATCWDEVRLIAQLIGGFAYADREGKIRFRNFNDLSSTPVLEIPAGKRFRADLQEGQFAVKAVTYTDDDGDLYTSSTSITDADTTSVVCIDYNKYVQHQGNDDSFFIAVADNILGKISHIRTVPGTVDFYGDPSLDLGDMVLLTNTGNQGIGGSDVKFLITGIYWQFNGPQTITAAGAPSQGDYVSSSGSSGSHATPIPGGGSTIATANINTVALKGYIGALFPTARPVARVRFSNVARVNAFLECSLTIMGTDSTNVKVAVYVDDELQTVAPQSSAVKGRYTTISFTLEMPLPSGIHTVRVTALGVSELTKVSGCVWGQNISSEPLLYSNEYTYTITDNKANCTGYTGEATTIEIPEVLGGKDTDTIAAPAFSDSDIICAYIPEGVTVIE